MYFSLSLSLTHSVLSYHFNTKRCCVVCIEIWNVLYRYCNFSRFKTHNTKYYPKSTHQYLQIEMQKFFLSPILSLPPSLPLSLSHLKLFHPLPLHSNHSQCSSRFVFCVCNYVFVSIYPDFIMKIIFFGIPEKNKKKPLLYFVLRLYSIQTIQIDVLKITHTISKPTGMKLHSIFHPNPLSLSSSSISPRSIK